MIIFDANVIIAISKAKDGEDIWRKLHGLSQEIKKSKRIIGIPAPALSEFLTGAADGQSDFLSFVGNKGGIKILPFDHRAAIEAAQLINGSPGKRGRLEGVWQKVKIDWQIIAIAKTNNASMVYSGDEGVITQCGTCGLSAMKIEDLPMPPYQPDLLKHEVSGE